MAFIQTKKVDYLNIACGCCETMDRLHEECRWTKRNKNDRLKIILIITGSLMQTQTFEELINTAYEDRFNLTPDNVPKDLKENLELIIQQLNTGELRVAEKVDGIWVTYEWLKKAILLYFKITANQPINGCFTEFFDKIPLKPPAPNVRIVPPAVARIGAYIGPNSILMPSYVNIGAYIDSGTMIDTWATVGSCAQIGKNVHLSGGAGIGGVLEPLQANPTIIEDHCFIGARSEIVEGVIVEEGSVISMGVFIGQSTRIYDRATDTISYGRIPAGSVVVPGNLPSADGKYSLYCAVIVKKVDAKTREKTTLNEILRGIEP
jgi:2,3,4,5-tetrahydropyridine-2-carboxylate N-succinyltransferase